MKSFYRILMFAFLPFLGCDTGAVCVYANKDVTVFNNTSYDITVIIRDNFSSLQVGTMKSFEVKSFNVQHSVIIEAGTVNFSDQLYVDPCRQTFELIVED